MKVTTFVSILLATSKLVASYDVLLALPISTKHLSEVFCGIAKGLVNRGHEVAFLSPHPPNFSHENMSIYKIPKVKPLLSMFNQFESNASNLHQHVLSSMQVVSKAMWEISIPIKDLLTMKDKFHAVITPTYLNELAYPFLVNYSGVYIDVLSPGVDQFVVTHIEEHVHYPVNPLLDAPYYLTYSLKDKFLFSLAAIHQLQLSKSGVLPGTESIVKIYHDNLGDLDRFVFIFLTLHNIVS